MKLTWLGHACFLLEADGYRIVTDPYTGVPGYPSLSVSAHAVFCSHGHFDHNAVDCVTLLPHRDSPFTVREIASFHDDRGGTLRGGNTIRVFTADGISVAHLGDLGHPLSAEQLAAIGPVDAALVPVGGVYTLDAAGAKSVCDALKPRCVLPHALPPRSLRVGGGERRGAVSRALAAGGGTSSVRPSRRTDKSCLWCACSAILTLRLLTNRRKVI